MENNTEKRPCVYCSVNKGNQNYLLNPNAEQEVYCCSSECYNKAREFMIWDQKNRLKAYLLILPCVVFNLICMSMFYTFKWRYLSLSIIGVVLWFFPLVFTRYTSYERYGIEKTIYIIKRVGIAIALLGIVFSIWG